MATDHIATKTMTPELAHEDAQLVVGVPEQNHEVGRADEQQQAGGAADHERRAEDLAGHGQGMMDAVEALAGEFRIHEPVERIHQQKAAVENSPGDAEAADHGDRREQADHREIDVLPHRANHELRTEERAGAQLGRLHLPVRGAEGRRQKAPNSA